MECEAFKQKSPNERWQIVKTKGACFNCLSTTRKANACDSRFSCKTCEKKHHTLLHEKFRGEEQPVATSKSTSTPAVNETQREVSKIAFSLKCKQDSGRVKRFKVVPVEVWGNNQKNQHILTRLWMTALIQA